MTTFAELFSKEMSNCGMGLLIALSEFPYRSDSITNEVIYIIHLLLVPHCDGRLGCRNPWKLILKASSDFS